MFKCRNYKELGRINLECKHKIKQTIWSQVSFFTVKQFHREKLSTFYPQNDLAYTHSEKYEHFFALPNKIFINFISYCH
jgi:hypothetical protein